MIIAHEVPGFGRESTVHDVTPLKSRCFRLRKQTVPTQARGTPHLLDNRLTRVLFNKSEKDIKHVALDAMQLRSPFLMR